MSGRANEIMTAGSPAQATRSNRGDIIPGDIVRVFFRYIRPKRDPAGKIIETGKERPVLVLYIERYQLVVAYISTAAQVLLGPADIQILESGASFASTGLKESSIIKLGVLSTVKLNDVLSWYGSVDETLRNEINNKLSACFKI
jgi:hypothetical protein